MKVIRTPRPNELRKVEVLLAKLANMKAATKSAPITSAIRTA